MVKRESFIKVLGIWVKVPNWVVSMQEVPAQATGHTERQMASSMEMRNRY